METPMSGNYYQRETCRLCDSAQLTKVLPLTPTALCDEYHNKINEQPIYPLDLFQCNDCKFVQIEYVVSPETIYGDYIYVTTSSPGLDAHFASYADQVTKNLQLGKGNLVVDIGSNDGTLLNYFLKKGCSVLGVEPCEKIANHATSCGIETLPNYFDLALAKKIKAQYGSADLITMNNVFANVDDLNQLTKGVEYLLSDDGVLVIESSYVLDMVQNMVFDWIYHEHLSYLSIRPLIHFFAKFNMHLIRIESVSPKGGSMRYYFARNLSRHAIDQSVSTYTEKEKQANIDAVFFKHWANKIEKLKVDVISELEKHKGKKIIGYGASATSTTLIYHFGLEKYLDILIDDNPIKVGTFSPGTHIPVKKFSDIELDSDSIVLVLAWRFHEAICKKLTPFKCTAIIPLPIVKVIQLGQA